MGKTREVIESRGLFRGMDLDNIVSTMECPNLTYERADGNTTRQIDFAIQKLFEGKIVWVQDHWQNGAFRAGNRSLAISIAKRLNAEHNGVKYRTSKENETTMALELKTKQP